MAALCHLHSEFLIAINRQKLSRGKNLTAPTDYCIVVVLLCGHVTTANTTDCELVTTVVLIIVLVVLPGL